MMSAEEEEAMHVEQQHERAGKEPAVKASRSIPLNFTAALISPSEEELDAQWMPGEPFRPYVVGVYLGDQEVARITDSDLVLDGTAVMLDETVARWLRRKLGS